MPEVKVPPNKWEAGCRDGVPDVLVIFACNFYNKDLGEDKEILLP
jgi:hypothetical protein